MSFLFDLFNRASPNNNAFQTNLALKSSNQTSSSSSSARGPGPTINQVRQLEPLPHGWEQLKDATGRISYGNRALNTVQWDRPSSPKPSPSLDLEDLYYFYSYEQGPYVPVSEDDISTRARNLFGNGDQRDHNSYIYWTPGPIPKTNATGWLSQDLNGPTFFAVRVDGLNKGIIDAYNATFTNSPTPFPLKLKYFYYTRFRSKEYVLKNFNNISFRQSLRLNQNRSLQCDNLISNACWGELQQIPDTNAMGFMTNDGVEGDKMIYVRVDRANNAIIEAYNASLKNPSSTSAPAPAQPLVLAPPTVLPAPQSQVLESVNPPAPLSNPAPLVPASSSDPAQALPPGWEQLIDAKTGGISYGNKALNTVQWYRPANLPPGWEELKEPEPSGRIYYGNRELKVVQYELPMLYEMGGKTFSSTNALLNNIYLKCPTYTSECKVTAAPAAAAGGSKNKKKHGCITKRRRHRRKASRRKASRSKASRRRTGKK